MNKKEVHRALRHTFIKFRNILLQGLPNLASSSIGFCAKIRHTVLPLFDTLYKI